MCHLKMDLRFIKVGRKQIQFLLPHSGLSSFLGVSTSNVGLVICTPDTWRHTQNTYLKHPTFGAMQQNNSGSILLLKVNQYPEVAKNMILRQLLF